MAGIKKTSGVEGTVSRPGTIEGEVRGSSGITSGASSVDTRNPVRTNTIVGDVRGSAGVLGPSGSVSADRVITEPQIEGEVRNLPGQIFGDRGRRSIDVEDTLRERGGVAWRVGTDYSIGDITTFDQLLYECTSTDTNSQTSPDMSANWKVLSSSISVSSAGNDPAIATELVWDASTGFEVVADPDNAGRFIIREIPPVIPFAGTSSFTPTESNVFEELSSNPTLTFTRSTGTFTSFNSINPTGGTASGSVITWANVTPFNAAGTYNFTAVASGTDSAGADQTQNISGRLVRFIPEYIMASQPATFADFTGARRGSTSLTTVASPTFFATTTDYGAIARGDVNGFPANFPRVAQITSTADQAGMEHQYNVYRIGVAANTNVSMLRS